jgi:hypothetical protein
MDQSFSPRNLRRVWDRQTRRGKHLLPLFPDVRSAYELARDARERARAISRGTVAYVGPDPDEPQRTARDLRSKADLALSDALGRTSEQLIEAVEAGTFSWGLKHSFTHNGRQLFEIAATPEAYFADKQLQLSVAALLPSRPPSRQAIVSGLARTLDNPMPKVLVRADVKAFFDSVDHELLLGIVRASHLSPTSAVLIKALLDEAAAISGAPKGVPAGVGLSAKLAELYITQADRVIREEPGVLYYARYVDDIVLVCGELSNGHPSTTDCLAMVEKAVVDLRLALNLTKQVSARLDSAGNLSPFEFLGYEFSTSATKLTVRLTPARVTIIEDRIDRAFEAWLASDPTNHGRRRLLADRLRLLAGNIRLANNKRNAMVGIYFSNPHLTDRQLLTRLDGFLRGRAARAALPPGLDVTVAQISFLEGFEKKKMYRFTPSRMKQIRGAWNA